MSDRMELPGATVRVDRAWGVLDEATGIVLAYTAFGNQRPPAGLGEFERTVVQTPWVRADPPETLDDESDVHAALARVIATIPGATAAHSEAALAAVRPYLRRPAAATPWPIAGDSAADALAGAEHLGKVLRATSEHLCEEECASDRDGRTFLLPCRHPEHEATS